MQFNVPQFLEIEDKIIGPLTLRQFGFLGGAGVVIFLLNYFAPNTFVFILITIPVSLLALALAFIKINGRPFIYFLGSFIGYLLKPKLFIWKRNKQRS